MVGFQVASFTEGSALYNPCRINLIPIVMPTRFETLNTALLYLEILRIIPKTRYICIQDICHHLDSIGMQRDKRTIQRIMPKLCEYFEIEADTRSRPYGYRWKSHARGLEVPLLNASDSLVLALAQQQLKYLLPANIIHSMEPFFTQEIGRAHV